MIDELNRGDVLSVFGELLTALDRQNNNIQVKLKNKDSYFILPENLYIIGTMNDVDSSIDKLDNAIYRRFPIINFNDFDIFSNWISKRPHLKEFEFLNRFKKEKLPKYLKEMLQEFSEPFAMSVFLDESLDKEIDVIWKTKVYPYLWRNWDREHLDKIATWKTWDLFKDHHKQNMIQSN